MSVRSLPLRIAGAEVTTGDWIDVRSPWSGELFARAAKAGPSEIESAIAAAAAGFEETRRLPSHRRAEILRRLGEELSRIKTELADTIVAEAGKPRRYAEAEVERGLTTVRLASEEATRIGGEVLPVDIEPRGEGAFCAIRRFPVGPVTAITPFNFPLNLALHKVAPALAAGNPVILKPSPRTPGTADLLARAVEASGWPGEAFSLVHADPDVARPLWTDERVRCVSFTGSDVVGWKIKAEAAAKKVTLELGGNAAAIVCEDAAIEDAAEKLATAAFAYAGQVCIKAQRLIVARSIYEPFLAAFLAAAKKIEPADPAGTGAVLGPMIDSESATRVESWIGEAATAGAQILLPARREGSKLWPVVAANVPAGTNLREREIFGPVATVEAFDRFDDAIRSANDTRYGLQASVFTRDIARVMEAFERLEVGGVIVNEAPTLRIDNFPYGGTKASGFGREGVRYAIEEMTERRVLFLRTPQPTSR
jgi:acyl-CoA reductase-like NAD-dependent aldehyde dehydrogenase